MWGRRHERQCRPSRDNAVKNFSFLLFLLFPLSVVLGGELAVPVVEGSEGKRAFNELGAFYRSYEDPGKKLDYLAALRHLQSEDGAVRARAGRYLLALFKQSHADEANGRAPWSEEAGPGVRYSSMAREFRDQLALSFGMRAAAPEALEATRWLLEEETVAANQIAGLKVLRRIRVPETAAIFKQLLAQPHPNGAVAAGVIEEVGKRRLGALAPEIRRLCTHYRTAVRQAARAAAPRLGIHRVPEFKPEDAFTPWLDAALKRIAAMVYPPIPKDAKWVRIRTTDPRHVEEGRTAEELSGWLLGGPGEKDLRVVDCFGRELHVAARDTTVELRTLSDGAQALRAEVDRLAKQGLPLPLDVEEDEDPADVEPRARVVWPSDSQHAYTRPPWPQHPATDLRVALVGAWCYVRGHRRAAARLLFPPLDELEDDRWLVEGVRDQLAGHYWEDRRYCWHTGYQQEILERHRHADYEAVLAYADHLSKPAFEGHIYQGWAKALAAGLRQRRRELGALSLPEHAKWDALKEKLSRREQIELLVSRIVLMNGDQWIRRRGATSYHSGSTLVLIGDDKSKVINPFRRLVNMKLTVGDLPALVPFLADDTPMPARRPHECPAKWNSVGSAVAEIVNEVACHDLSGLAAYYRLGEAGKKRHLDRIVAWCKARADRTERQVLTERIEKESDWDELRDLVDRTYKLGGIDLVPLVLRREADFPKQQRFIVELCYCIAGARVVPQARRWLKDKETGVRFWAALILLKHGDRATLEALAELKAITEARQGAGWAAYALEDLLETQREEAIALACTMLEQADFSPHDEPALHRLFLAGRQECLDYLLRTLDSPKITGSVTGEWQGKEVTRPTGPADHVAHSILHWRTGHFEYDELAPADVRRRKREDLKAWLRQQFALIKAGKKPQMDPYVNPMDLTYYWWAMRPERNKRARQLLPGNPRIRRTTAIVEDRQ